MERSIDSSNQARIAFDAMADRQADDLVILDLRPVSILTDFFVLGTAGSTRQMRAVAGAVEEALRKEAQSDLLAREGEPESGWILLDFNHVIVHVFDPERREYYDLESMWSEAPLVARMA